jgi:hypothetical protein
VALHPATVLLTWISVVLALQSLSLSGVIWAALLLLPLPLILARRRVARLLRRARWLLLSIAIMFALASPGQHLPGILGDFGVTYDGLELAAEHSLRLILLLVTLALVHEVLGTNGLMAGLHWLLAPLSGWRSMRERMVVRLMLVLDYVEATPVGNWRTWLAPGLFESIKGSDAIDLAVYSAGAIDWAVIGLLATLALLAGWLA